MGVYRCIYIYYYYYCTSNLTSYYYMALNLHKWEKLTVQNHANTTKSCFMEMVRCNATPSYRINWLLRFVSLSYINVALRKLLNQRLLGCFCTCKPIIRKIRAQDNKIKSSYKSEWDLGHTKPSQNIQKSSHVIVLVRFNWGTRAYALILKASQREEWWSTGKLVFG